MRRTRRPSTVRAAVFMGEVLVISAVDTVVEWLQHDVSVTARASDLPIQGSTACVVWEVWDMAGAAWVTVVMAGEV
ncbi:MAG TPA: hypothetical protein VFA61_02165 [Candidatus Udaeobacter sp.]|nr:hypothetical protein [Candidatus Udaeobacter sp.]